MLYGEGAIAARVAAAARGLQSAISAGFNETRGAFAEFCREARGGRVEATLVLEGYAIRDCGEAWRERVCGVLARLLEVGMLRRARPAIP